MNISHSLLFLKENCPLENLRLLSQPKFVNGASPCTEKIYRSLPRWNAVRLGFTPKEFQTRLGDDFLAGSIAASTLGTIALLFSRLVSCTANANEAIEVAVDRCYQETGQWVISPSPVFTALGISMCVLIAAYTHYKGWLGKWLHDPFRSSRFNKVKALFEAMAKEMAAKEKQINDPQPHRELREIKAGLRQNMALIKTQLAVDLQFEKSEVKELMGVFKWICT